jgi:hypothetical protein
MLFSVRHALTVPHHKELRTISPCLWHALTEPHCSLTPRGMHLKTDPQRPKKTKKILNTHRAMLQKTFSTP